MTGDGWYHLADEVERLDTQAGRALRAALARHTEPLRVQVAGRAGTGRENVEAAVRSAVPDDVEITAVILDAPSGPDPVLDADVLVLVVPRRPVAHPADRTAADGATPERLLVVVPGAGEPDRLAVAAALAVPPEHALAGPPPHAPYPPDDALAQALAACLSEARHSRELLLARTAAGLAVAPTVRDRVEDVLDEVAVW